MFELSLVSQFHNNTYRLFQYYHLISFYLYNKDDRSNTNYTKSNLTLETSAILGLLLRILIIM